MKRINNAARQFAVYSIIDRDAALAAIEGGGTGTLNENKSWVTAAKHFDSKPAAETIPLLLADAGSNNGVEWAGTICRIELLDNRRSRVQFTDLSFIRNRIPRSTLLKASDGEPLNEHYIRPYMPCLLTDEVIGMVGDIVAEEPGWGEAQFGAREAAAEIDEDPETQNLPETVRQALIQARIGQGAYRDSLLDIWGGRCAVTGCAIPEVLIASHAKPWSQCNPRERLDEYNGLLLAASVDRLFDQGLISFTDDGQLLVVDSLSDNDLRVVGLNRSARLYKVLSRHRPYLREHRVANGFEK